MTIIFLIITEIVLYFLLAMVLILWMHLVRQNNNDSEENMTQISHNNTKKNR